MMERAKQISDLELQPAYVLHAGITYRADFRYREKGKWVVEDVKGFVTEVFRLKARLFAAAYPNVGLRVVK